MCIHESIYIFSADLRKQCREKKQQSRLNGESINLKVHNVLCRCKIQSMLCSNYK